jgi:DNA-binding HxlR family transcriptional regulator
MSALPLATPKYATNYIVVNTSFIDIVADRGRILSHMGSRSYAQFCPVSRALDLLGERWSLLIVRQLLIEPHRYTDLAERLSGISPTVLRDRLRDLEAAGIVRRAELPPPAARTVYELTDRGRALEPVLYEMARWGLPLLDTPSDDEPMLPFLVGMGLKTFVRTEALPDGAMTIGLDLDEGAHAIDILPPEDTSGRTRHAVERVTVDAPSDTSPPDVTIRSSIPVLLLLRRGDIRFEDAAEAGLIEITGARAAVATAHRMFAPEAMRAAATRA